MIMKNLLSKAKEPQTCKVADTHGQIIWTAVSEPVTVGCTVTGESWVVPVPTSVSTGAPCACHLICYCQSDTEHLLWKYGMFKSIPRHINSEFPRQIMSLHNNSSPKIALWGRWLHSLWVMWTYWQNRWLVLQLRKGWKKGHDHHAACLTGCIPFVLAQRPSALTSLGSLNA